MGGISATVPTDNPMAMIANPGQVGLAALKNYFSVTIYAPKTKWFPQFSQSDLTYNVTAFGAGLNLEKVLPIPVPVSIGIGYSRIFFNLGKFTVTGSDPTVLYTFDVYEKAENVSIGVGIDYWIKLGIGVTIKNIVSSLPGPPYDSIQVPGMASATGFGIVARIPLMEILSRLQEEPLTFLGARPLCDFTACYVRDNVGGEIVYADVNQADPLPRKATLGLSWEIGLLTGAQSDDWKLFSFTWAREAEDILVTRLQGGGFEYQRGLGDLQFFDNIVLGRWNEKVFLRKGWQICFAEILYLRGGSVIGPGISYGTTGFGLRLGGVIKLLESFESWPDDESLIGFVLNHFDIRYDQSSYGSTQSPIHGTDFRGLTFIIK